MEFWVHIHRERIVLSYGHAAHTHDRWYIRLDHQRMGESLNLDYYLGMG